MSAPLATTCAAVPLLFMILKGCAVESPYIISTPDAPVGAVPSFWQSVPPVPITHDGGLEPVDSPPDTCTVPLPLAASDRLMFVSLPVAPMVTVAGLAVAALVIVTPSTAEDVALESIKGFPLASLKVLVKIELTVSLPLASIVAVLSPPMVVALAHIPI